MAFETLCNDPSAVGSCAQEGVVSGIALTFILFHIVIVWRMLSVLDSRDRHAFRAVNITYGPSSYRLVENLLDPDDTVISKIDDYDSQDVPRDLAILKKRADVDRKKYQGPGLEKTTMGLAVALFVVEVVRAVLRAAGTTWGSTDESPFTMIMQALSFAVAIAVLKITDAKHVPVSFHLRVWWVVTFVMQLIFAADVSGSDITLDSLGTKVSFGLLALKTLIMLANFVLVWVYYMRHVKSQAWQDYKDAKAKEPVTNERSYVRLFRLVAQDKVLVFLGVLGAIVQAMCTVSFNILWGDVITAIDDEDKPLNFAFASILSQEVAFFDESKTGELMTVLSTNAVMIQDALTSQLAQGLQGLVVCVGIIFYLLFKSWRLTLVFFGSALVPFLAIGGIGFYVKVYTKAQTEKKGIQGERAQEFISCVTTVKSFGQEEYVKDVYKDTTQETYDVSMGLISARSMLACIGLGGFYAVFAVGFWYGGHLAIDHPSELDPGFLLSFVLLAFQMITGLGKVVNALPEMAKALGAGERIFSIIDRVPKLRYRGGTTIAGGLRGEITFENIHFRYPSRPHVPVLRGLSVQIDAGQQVAFVGPSGGGKSTVLAMMQRFYDPDDGHIIIDGVPMVDLDPLWLRRNIGVVLQEPVLFSGTIRDNLLFGRPDATDRQLRQACKDANAFDFIMKQPEAFDTKLGERGVMLSGGQKQRIAIARALLKDPKILLLDEATSALDSESETLVQQALDRLMEGRTTLVIAHRLSTIKDADIICVVERGVIVEQGLHNDLIAAGGVYTSLAEKANMKGEVSEEAEESAIIAADQAADVLQEHPDVVHWLLENESPAALERFADELRSRFA